MIPSIFEQMMTQLTTDEKKALHDRLTRMIDSEMIDAAMVTGEAICPRCGCLQVTKKGFHNGSQQYLCKGCARRFSAKTGRILALSKLPRDTWVAYARCMLDGLTLQDCADRCVVCLKTSFFMRHRICEVMAANIDSFRIDSGCAAEIDEFNLRESFAGNHSKSQGFELPRKRRRRGKGEKRGISNDLICILTGVNDHGDCFLEVACRGRLTKQSAQDILADKVCEGSIISTDRHQSYKNVIPGLGAAVHNRYDSKDRSAGTINSVNALHARLADFLRPFHGVASRRLTNYLSWFQWIESFKKLPAHSAVEALAVKHIANGHYDTRWRDYKDTPYPFSEHYGWAV